MTAALTTVIGGALAWPDGGSGSWVMIGIGLIAIAAVLGWVALGAPGLHTIPTGEPSDLHARARESSQTRKGAAMRRPTINITPAERVGRVLIGAVGAIGGIILLTGATGAGIIALEVLLVAFGIDMIVTGALGHCPLYKKLGHTPRSLRGAV